MMDVGCLIMYVHVALEVCQIEGGEDSHEEEGGGGGGEFPLVALCRKKTLRILAWTSIYLPFTVPHDQISPYTHLYSHAYNIYMCIHVNTCEKFEFMA